MTDSASDMFRRYALPTIVRVVRAYFYLSSQDYYFVTISGAIEKFSKNVIKNRAANDYR